MKLLEIEELNLNEINDQLKKSRLELLELHMKLATRQLDNPSLIKKKRLDISRLLTIQTQKSTSKISEDSSHKVSVEKDNDAEKPEKAKQTKKKKISRVEVMKEIKQVKKTKKGSKE